MANFTCVNPCLRCCLHLGPSPRPLGFANSAARLNSQQLSIYHLLDAYLGCVQAPPPAAPLPHPPRSPSPLPPCEPPPAPEPSECASPARATRSPISLGASLASSLASGLTSDASAAGGLC